MRQELEAEAVNGLAVFLTLTFGWWSRLDDEAAVKAAMQGFVKRLRALIDDYATPEDLARFPVSPAMLAGLSPGHFRFLGAVERGSRGTRRLHGHVNLFGLSLDSSFGGVSLRRLIVKAWQGRGFVKAKPFRPGAARYVAKYLVKSASCRLMSKGGRSGLGGLGAPAVAALAATHQAGAADVERKVMMPAGHFVFLDRYLADRLRRAVGLSASQLAALSAARLRELVARTCRERWLALGGTDESRYLVFAAHWRSVWR